MSVRLLDSWKMYDKYKQMIRIQSFLLLALFCIHAGVHAETHSSQSCGNVTGTIEGNRLELRFEPSEFFRAIIPENNYRWLNGIHIIRKLNLTNKYQETRNHLTITNISANDNGEYYVDCWASGDTHQSVRWTFNYNYFFRENTTATTTTPSSTPTQQIQSNARTVTSTKSETVATTPTKNTIPVTKGQDPVLGSSNDGTQPLISQSTIIVVAVCVVLVALIVAGTVVVVRVKGKRPKPEELKSENTTQEGTSKEEPASANVYGEISTAIQNKPGRKSSRFKRRSKRRLPDVPQCACPPSENQYADISLDDKPLCDKLANSNISDLQYADLDLINASKPDGDLTGSKGNTFGDMGKCQYASIDFEQNAFVAPIRKAPSSWYKRKNKDRKGT